MCETLRTFTMVEGSPQKFVAQFAAHPVRRWQRIGKHCKSLCNRRNYSHGFTRDVRLFLAASLEKTKIQVLSNSKIRTVRSVRNHSPLPLNSSTYARRMLARTHFDVGTCVRGAIDSARGPMLAIAYRLRNGVFVKCWVWKISGGDLVSLLL